MSRFREIVDKTLDIDIVKEGEMIRQDRTGRDRNASTESVRTRMQRKLNR